MHSEESLSGRHELSSLRDYLRVLGRRKWLIVLAAIVVPTAAVLASLSQQRLYQASADVLLSRQNLAASLGGTVDPDFYQEPERFGATQEKVARVPALAERVLSKTGLTDRTPSELVAALDVSATPEADLLQFRVTDPSPTVAATLATAYAEEYTRYRGELDQAAFERARAAVGERLEELRAAGDTESDLYKNLVEKEDQLKTMEAVGTSKASVLGATSDAKQVQPRPVRNGLLGLALGLLAGVAFAFLLEALDTRVRSTDEIGAALGLPLLARIPEPPRRVHRKDRLVMIEEPKGVHAESFRILRTNLDFMSLEREARTIMVTSAVAQEGKTTTVANLGVALARAGRRVIVADLDLRRPSLARFFELEGRSGLTDVAMGHVALEDALATVALTQPEREAEPATGVNGHGRITGVLNVLPSGPIPPDPGEFVGTKAVMDVIDQLHLRADVVLIDTPPMLQVGDAMALSPQVDAIVLVTRLSLVRRSMLAELRRLLVASPAAKLGLVVTGAEFEEAYGYGAYPYPAPSARQRERVS